MDADLSWMAYSRRGCEMVTFGDEFDMDKATKARITWKVRRKQCLQCSSAADGWRGLCKQCENKWKVAIRKVPAERREKFNESRVAKGLILASNRGKRAKQPNPFL